MKETNEKRQIATMWILTVLMVMLIAIISGLIFRVIKLKRETKTERPQEQITNMNETQTVGNIMQENHNSKQQEMADNELNKTFDERTKSFFKKKKELNDKEKKDFANVRLSKVDNHYEIVADIVGNIKIDSDTLQNAIKKMQENKLDKLEVKTSNNKNVIIYSSRPDETKYTADDIEYEFSKDEVNSLGYVNIPVYDDFDWFNATSDNEWLDEEGIPMYIDASSITAAGDKWAKLRKENDEYYIYSREGAGRAEPYLLTDVTETNAVRFSLLLQDKIVLTINDVYGDLPDNYQFKEVTVDEYFKMSPTTLEDNLRINASNMSEANYHAAGLDISDGKVHVVARCDGQ